MSYKIYKINPQTFERIIEIPNIFSLNWQDDITLVFTSFDITTSYSDLNCGDWIEVFSPDYNDTVFFGVVMNSYQENTNNFTYSGYDAGIYLEKNETTCQFRDAKIAQAIETACQKGELNAGVVPDIDFTVNKIYFKTKLSDILFDLYNIAVDKGFDNSYYFNCKNGKINLLRYTGNNELRGYVANLYSVKSFDNIKKFKRELSIKDLKNSIELYTSNTPNKDNSKRLYYKNNSESIEKYGLLNVVEEIDADTNLDFEKILTEKLNKLNKVSESLEFEVLGDYKLQTGVYTIIKNDDININGTYKITSSKHRITGTVESVTVTVDKYNID